MHHSPGLLGYGSLRRVAIFSFFQRVPLLFQPCWISILVILALLLYSATHTQKSKKPDWDVVYERYRILTRTDIPIKTPLLALPYGKPNLPSKSGLERESLVQSLDCYRRENYSDRCHSFQYCISEFVGILWHDVISIVPSPKVAIFVMEKVPCCSYHIIGPEVAISRLC